MVMEQRITDFAELSNLKKTFELTTVINIGCTPELENKLCNAVYGHTDNIDQ